MRSLSCAIIAASGLLCFTASAFIAHSGTQGFMMFVTGMVGLIGLGGWAYSTFGCTEPSVKHP